MLLNVPRASFVESALTYSGLRQTSNEKNAGQYVLLLRRRHQPGRARRANPVVIMLNNDMVVEPDFVQPLLDGFASEPDVFGVSCQIDFIDPAKPRWETGKVHGELRRGVVRLFHLDRFDDDLIYPIFFAGGGASAYDRARFLELGGFDDDVFSPVYIEDVDLGYRAWKRGWASVLAPRSMVHHKHRGTTRRLWSEGVIHSFFLKNLAALLWKNVGSWRLLTRHLAGLTLLPLKAFREQGGRCAMATFTGLVKQIPVDACGGGSARRGTRACCATRRSCTCRATATRTARASTRRTARTAPAGRRC